MGLIVFSFLKKAKKINGLIAYFNLSDWWQLELSQNDRNKIMEKYQPMGSGSVSLTDRNISSTSQTPIALLCGMVGWFAKEEDRHIAYKLIEKAEDLIDLNSHALDIHFLYGTKVEISYKDRTRLTEGLETAIKACEQQIFFSKKSAGEFLKKYKGSPLPSHRGFLQLAIIREKQKEFEQVITLCNQALSDGWFGDWEKRIVRCKRKMNL